jgi:vacuolar protein sorting-associated protein 45
LIVDGCSLQTPIISLALSQSEILKEEVYLFEKLGQPNREAMTHLQAICFLRPTESTLEDLKKELRDPKYGTYYLFFTNSVSEQYLREIAYADELEVVKEVHEYYADFYAVNADMWHLSLKGSGVLDANQPSWGTALGRITDGLAACLLSLKIRPSVRVQRTSALAMQVGQSIKSRIENSSTFHVGQTKQTAPLLVIMDRNEDPVTPLLTAWTYQAMLHQILEMHNNRMDLSNVLGIRDELKQIVVSSTQDDFYKSHMYDDFGEVGLAIKDFADQFAHETHSNSKLESIEDIKRFVEKYPEFRKTSGSVSKHVAIASELQKQVGMRKLMDISKVEQELACHEDHEEAVTNVSNLLRQSGIQPKDALRVVLLYALRYASQANNRMEEFVNMLLKDYQIPDHQLVVIRMLREYSAPNKRSPSLDLLENESWLSSAKSKMKRGLVGIQNVFTQHRPLLQKIAMLIREQKLDAQAYPFVVGQPTKLPPTEVIIFVVGGITFEEAAAVRELNAKADGFNYVLGGTGLIRPEEFIKEILEIKRS